MQGSANTWIVRGKKRHGFDLALSLAWELTTGAAVTQGVAKWVRVGERRGWGMRRRANLLLEMRGMGSGPPNNTERAKASWTAGGLTDSLLLPPTA